MNQRLMVNLEVVKGERSYTLQIPSGAPLGEVYDSVHEMLVAVLELSKQATESAKAAQPDMDPVEPEVV